MFAVYLFRSPIAGLISTIPAVCFLTWLLVIVAEAYEFDGVVVAGVVLLLGLVILSRLLARHRLFSPVSASWGNTVLWETTKGYPYQSSPACERPNQIAALLWQQYRQLRVPAFALTILLAAAWVLLAANQEQEVQLIALSIVAALLLFLGPCWLGGLTFYADNTNQQHRYFADRGISNNLVWWTRLAIPSACLIAILLFARISHAAFHPEVLTFDGAGYGLILFVLTQFSIGLFVGQWMRRTSLAFMLSPVLLCIGMVATAYFFDRFATYTVGRNLLIQGSAAAILIVRLTDVS